MAKFDDQWMSNWLKKVNEDKVFSLIGKYFTANFLIGIGENEYLLSLRNGKVEDFTDEISSVSQWQFALRAPSESWSKFSQPIPPPKFNDIWAMAHPLHGRLKIEGDTKIFWQNVRALTWMLDLMRAV